MSTAPTIPDLIGPSGFFEAYTLDELAEKINQRHRERMAAAIAERDEARAEVELLRQGATSRIRVEHTEVQVLRAENAAMREAIKEAHAALVQLSECRIFCADSMDIDNYVTDDCDTALAKLQPFLK